jgi:hypothetical protein
MDSITQRRVDLGFEIKDRIAARLRRMGMDEQHAESMACRDMIAARRVGLRKVHGVSIVGLLR